MFTCPLSISLNRAQTGRWLLCTWQMFIKIHFFFSPRSSNQLTSDKGKSGDSTKSSETLFFFPIELNKHFFPLGELTVYSNITLFYL